MRGSGKQFGSARERQARAGSKQVTTKGQGDQAEALARAFLQSKGLRWVQSNFRSPGRDADNTLVFVEVRQRSRSDFGGAGSSIDGLKRSRIIFAARHYLMRLPSPPPCRFDVVLIDGGPNDQGEVSWFKAAFDAS